MNPCSSQLVADPRTPIKLSATGGDLPYSAPAVPVSVYLVCCGNLDDGALDQQVVCKVPVFDFPAGGKGANSNSLNGLHNSLIVQNTYGYLFDWDTGTLMHPGAPGIERIDINRNGKGCTKVWVNTDVATNACPKLSTRTGLIYTQERKYDAENDLYAVYWVALDFRTGEVVWEKLAGTFDRLGPARFDNFWAGIGIGPNGAMYSGQYSGVTMIRDMR